MKLFILFFIAAAMAEEEPYPYELEYLLVDGSSMFTFDMLRAVTETTPDKNLVMSGYSAMSPLAQLSLASVGDTHDEILRVISMPNDTMTRNAFVFANNLVESVKKVDLKIANSIFIPVGYELNNDFNAVSKEVFRAEVKQVDFIKNVEAAATINTWVEDHTNNKIKDLVRAADLGPGTKAVLVNALYFKGSWDFDYKFDPAKTQDRDFHVTKDKTIKWPTMYRHGDYFIADSEEMDSKFLEIPYDDDQVKFVVALPNKVDGIAALEENLKNVSLFLDVVRKTRKTETEVYLPKFKIETEINLKKVLEKMDVKRLFKPDSGIVKLITGDKIHISDAIQKAYIEVNEEGAEAAAASQFHGRGASLYVPKKQIFMADHPFLFFIMNRNNIIFFNGAFYGKGIERLMGNTSETL